MELKTIDLGVLPFKDAFSEQVRIQKAVFEGLLPSTLILCEHPHTITLSRQAKLSNLIDYALIRDSNIDLIIGLDRGGDITYHGPGQLMGYFLFDLRQFRRDLGLFLSNIERVLTSALTTIGIDVKTKDGYRGAWVGDRKIASIGIGVNKWVTIHGFGLNVNTDLKYFNLIKPCGLDVKMTSMKEESGRELDINLVKREIANQVREIFSLEIDSSSPYFYNFRAGAEIVGARPQLC